MRRGIVANPPVTLAIPLGEDKEKYLPYNHPQYNASFSLTFPGFPICHFRCCLVETETLDKIPSSPHSSVEKRDVFNPFHL